MDGWNSVCFFGSSPIPVRMHRHYTTKTKNRTSAKEAVQDGARRVGLVISTLVWHTQVRCFK